VSVLVAKNNQFKKHKTSSNSPKKMVWLLTRMIKNGIYYSLSTYLKTKAVFCENE